MSKVSSESKICANKLFTLYTDLAEISTFLLRKEELSRDEMEFLQNSPSLYQLLIHSYLACQAGFYIDVSNELPRLIRIIGKYKESLNAHYSANSTSSRSKNPLSRSQVR